MFWIRKDWQDASKTAIAGLQWRFFGIEPEFSELTELPQSKLHFVNSVNSENSGSPTKKPTATAAGFESLMKSGD